MTGTSMTEIVNLGDIIVNYFNQDKTLQETAADLGAIVLEMEREERYNGKHTRRMAELKKLADVQERVFSKMVDRINDDDLPPPKVPRLQSIQPRIVSIPC